MPIWDHEDCDPAIEAEHTRLYRMMNRLEPVIIEGRTEATVTRAIHVLHTRMAEHFRIEEELFATADWDSRQLMRDDHHRLLELLDRLSRLAPADTAGRRLLFTSFIEALNRHDNDVDAPLFCLKH